MTGRLGRFAAAAAAGVALLAALAGAAYAVDDASIDHAEVADGQLKLLVSVPGGGDVDLDSVTVNIDGKDVDATAEAASSADDVERTTVLAIDTSNSMKGARIAEAKTAAMTYLQTVPANVQVGIVTFDSSVEVRQEPSLDRDASRSVINGLTLKQDTALYEGVKTAISTAAGQEGQQQVLVLSDGRDNTNAELKPVLDAISASKVKVDVVSLEQGAAAPEPLAQMATSSGGTVIAADTDALTEAFSSEADVLARQILVTATVPADQAATDATVTVSLDAAGQAHTASAFVTVKAAGEGTSQPATDPFEARPAETSGFEVPKTAMYGAVGAIGVGVIGLIIALATGSKDKRPGLDEQLRFYSASEESARFQRAKAAQPVPSGSLAGQAVQAAEKALASNAGFEARIATRLEAAGMSLKSSEWLLLHIVIAIGAGLVGLLFTAGNPLAVILFLALGAAGPWIYLSMKRSKRLKAFDAALPDTLQLMSGSLTAGLSLAQSLDTIVREGTEPIVGEFKRVIAETRLGVGLEDALDGIAERMESQDFKWVVMAIRIQREVGGNLAELLNTVANTLREREYLRRHVRALSAEGRLSCWILGGLPPGFMLYIAVTRRSYIQPLFTEPVGWLMIGVMLVLLFVGIFWMTRLVKVEV